MGGYVSRASQGLRCPLYAKPGRQQFTANQSRELAEYLQTLDQRTSVRSLNDVEELHLNENGQTLRDEYRFSSHAFRQAAQIVCPGLSKMLPDISGTVQLKDERDRLVDGRCAVRIWNDLVDLRFPLFERYRIIRNDHDRTIEGFVGQKHQYLENLWLYHEVSDLIAHTHPTVTMYAATMNGRRFSIWFRSSIPMFTLAVDEQLWPFYSGYYFTNGEATGTSVRGTLAVFTPKGVCLGAYRRFGKRVTHIGRDFMSRLGEMFSSVLQGEVPVDKLRAGADALLTRSLGFPLDSNKEQRKERSKKISHSLGLLGVQKNLAVEIVEKALAAGRHHGMDTQSWSQVNQLYASRTLLDLLVPLLWVARKVDIVRREKLEQAAFEILTGRLLL